MRTTCSLTLCCALLWAAAARAQAPYPQSKVITKISWDAKVVYKATGSDNWPLTWADDGELYTAYGDGWGFVPKVSEKLSLGFAKVSGPGSAFTGVNIRSSTGEQKGQGEAGKKASGMLSLGGVLYIWVRNADLAGKQCQLAWSSDHAKTWTWSGWKLAELGYCAFLNFGQDYAGALDGYVYMYSPDTASAYNETDSVVLTRVPKGQLKDRKAYEFFVKLDGGGKPVWSADITKRGPVFSFKGGCNRLDVVLDAPIKRFLLTMRSRAKAGGLDQFSIYDAPSPWGPWSTVYYTKKWDVDPGEIQHFPSKWISKDGKTLYMVFAGSDAFAVRRATLTVAAQPGQDGGPSADGGSSSDGPAADAPRGDGPPSSSDLDPGQDAKLDASAGDRADDGCSCAATPMGGASPWSLVVLGLLLWRRRSWPRQRAR